MRAQSWLQLGLRLWPAILLSCSARGNAATEAESIASCAIGETPFTDCYPSLGAPKIPLTLQLGGQLTALAEECIAWNGGRQDDVPGLVCSGSLAAGATVYQPEPPGVRFARRALPSDEHYVRMLAGDLDHDGCDDLVGIPLPQWFFDRVTDGGATTDASIFGGLSGVWTFVPDVWRGDCAWGLSRAPSSWGLRATVPVGDLFFGATLVDVNSDGRLDLVLWQDSVDARVDGALLLLSEGQQWSQQPAGVFGGVPGGSGFAIAPALVNRDLLPDLFLLSSCTGPSGTSRLGNPNNPGACYLLLGSSPGPAFVHDDVPGIFDQSVSWSPMGAACADTDGDGVNECVITDIGAVHYMQVTDSAQPPASVTLIDVGPKMGLDAHLNRPSDPTSGQFVAYDPVFFDVARTGDLGLFVTGATDGSNTGVPYTHVLSRSGSGFSDVTDAVLGPLARHGADGASPADFDGDGIEDLALDGWGTSLPGGPVFEPQLLINRSPGGRTLALRLRGRSSNTDGIGARVTVSACGKTRTLSQFPQHTTHGYGEHRLFFGLGTCSAADHVRVEWPSRQIQDVQSVPSGRQTIVEPR
jgi:hypothetical protein